LGDALAASGHRDAAVEHWNSVVTRLQPGAQDAGNPLLALLARALLRLDRPTQAREQLARLEASNYRHPAYADLVNELRHGAGPGRSTLPRR
jgi:hypothetical protein